MEEEEDELLIDKIDSNKALSYSAPLYLYYTNTSSLFNPSDHELSDFKFELCEHTTTPPDSTAMSFADELFHTGVLLPLKLPPRLQNFGGSSSVSGSVSPVMSSSKSVFARTNLTKQKDFDPFTVALEKIRKDESCTRDRELQPPRRSRSLSPLRNLNWVRKRENEVQKSNPSSRVFLQSDERRDGDGERGTTAGKSVLRKKKQIVLRMMKRPIVNYKQGFFTCFGIGL